MEGTFHLKEVTTEPINNKITHIELDLQDPQTIIYSIYSVDRTNYGKTGIGRYSTVYPSQRGIFLESSSQSDLWGFTQIDTQKIVIVDREQHFFRVYWRTTGQLRPLAGTCGLSQNCYACESYYYPYDVIYHKA